MRPAAYEFVPAHAPGGDGEDAMVSIETGYLITYECICGGSWQSTWSCACDDECPMCGTDVEALAYELDGTYSQVELDAFNGGAEA